MLKTKVREDSRNKTAAIHSSYFQTEFSRKSDGSSADEEVIAISQMLDNLPVEFDKRGNQAKSSASTKVSISVQTGRSIVGEEDSLPKERKRWTRPPGVGQASTSSDQNNVLCHSKESSSEDDRPNACSKRPETLEYVGNDIYQNRKDYIIEKPMEGSSDQSPPQLSDQIHFPPVVSPSSASSITSKPLEWDSGADVGYFQDYGTVPRSDQEFSTIERIALVQGRTGMLKRSDPEGTSSSKKGNTAVGAIGLPTAESTPVNSTEGSSYKDKNSMKKSMENKQKYHPLFPEVIILQKGGISDSTNDCCSPQKDMFADSFKDSKLKKLSSSLENVNVVSKSIEGQAATFPRSLSQSNLNSGELDYNSHLQRILNPPQSVSSSSVTTVVPGLPRKSSKYIQTSYLKNNVGIQYSLNGSLNKKNEEKKPKQNCYNTLDSAHLSVDDRVNSFEYLPGHVYENSSKEHDFWESNQGVSLQNDVERGVQIIEEFIQGSNANNTLMKKELLHRVVEKLIETDYPEDGGLFKTAPQRCATRRSQNREEVIGESSSEASQGARGKALRNSTSCSGQSTSALQNTTDSTMKSSEPSIQGPMMKNQGSGSCRGIDKQVGKDRSNDITTDLSSENKSDWKEPLTRAEKLYELKKKGFRKGDDQLIKFINSERENQIDWIVKEINHLSNLKTLLEKHEKLRKNLNRLKTAKSKNDLSPNRHNFVRPVGFKRRSQLNPSTNKSAENINLRRSKLSSLSEERGWDSHNYETDYAGRLKRSVSTDTRNLPRGAKSLGYTISFEPDIKPQKSSKPVTRPIIADRQTLEKESRTRVREAFRHPSLQVGRNAS